ncbi:acetate/propionate family kinase [Candidatus Magnetominusculus xianensis]|uniref:Acetate kinase n=1 Tax=Candidatus Magnetominusculus xianensis TaxID=1748249 RepID=A0ABR5SMV4_9BACT|nr:acetate/propionate family kinase [Candidatus Magnetominusculus xianensis]KWT92662.1 acetate kinase [Candidatus Magnetominusculus xianensis]MBF0403787.1 acetate/propionate family kinase [Nitrospirota bacterium]
MDLKAFLTSTHYFSDLSDSELNTLIEASTVEECRPGQKIVSRGQPGRFLFVLITGKAEVNFTDTLGAKLFSATLKSGDVFGEMSIMTGEPEAADVVAVEPSQYIAAPRDMFSQVIVGNPAALHKIAALITKRMTQKEQNEALLAQYKSSRQDNPDPYDLNFSSALKPAKILVINCGSSSLKYSLFDTSNPTPLIEGLIEKIGTNASYHKVKSQKSEIKNETAVPDFPKAFLEMETALTDSTIGAIAAFDEIDAVGHRVVHGGDKFKNSAVITDEVIEGIRQCIPLAPLHNPYNLAGVEEMRKHLPGKGAVAVFDTAFHQNMPESAYLYAISRDLGQIYHVSENIRRYGFHGTNHNYVSLTAATYLKRSVRELRIISCHLGNGASICAIDHGTSVDTSMGMTPLEGLAMGTRCGDIDPGALIYLLNSGLSVKEVDNLLNKESGLKGLTGLSNDMREILDAADSGNDRAKTAVSLFCYRLKKYIAAYAAVLGGIDALVFTAGIGENSAAIRGRVCHGLENIGLVISKEANEKAKVKRGHIEEISAAGSQIKILVVAADEERMIARETLHALNIAKVREAAAPEVKAKRQIPVYITGHHVHLCEKDFATLFGEGKTLTKKHQLRQQLSFVAEETLTLSGPLGKIENVRVVAPLKTETQVEISRTEEFKLGIDAPVRVSGDLEGSASITLEGPAGSVKLESGVICARRHIHMTPADALSYGIRDHDIVSVAVLGRKDVVFSDVFVRVNPNYTLELHLDTDEANSAAISDAATARILEIQSRAFI